MVIGKWVKKRKEKKILMLDVGKKARLLHRIISKKWAFAMTISTRSRDTFFTFHGLLFTLNEIRL